MKIFITATDTNIGKTIVSSWLCLHTGYKYFKPIQTGTIDDRDSLTVSNLCDNKNIIYPESYSYKEPLSPHLAAKLENSYIDINKIEMPKDNDLIVEGAGGVLAPINTDNTMIDLITYLNIPVILVCKGVLGSINHTLLSLEALRSRSVNVLGVIMTQTIDQNNIEAIEFYGQTKVIAQLPYLEKINHDALKKITIPKGLKEIIEA